MGWSKLPVLIKRLNALGVAAFAQVSEIRSPAHALESVAVETSPRTAVLTKCVFIAGEVPKLTR